MVVKNKPLSAANSLFSQNDRSSGRKNVASSISQEATQTQAGMQRAQKQIHAMMCPHVKTVLAGKLLLPCCLIHSVHTYMYIHTDSRSGHKDIKFGSNRKG